MKLGDTMSLQSDRFAFVRRCIVQIHDGDTGEVGTGFFVGPGLILTAQHVVPSGRAVVSWNGVTHDCVTLPLKLPLQADVALVRFPVQEHPVAKLGDAPRIRNAVRFVGFPFRDGVQHEESVTGEIEDDQFQHPSERDGVRLLKLKGGQTVAGSSGSPLVCDSTMEVVGVVTDSRDQSSDLGALAVPTQYIIEHCSLLSDAQRGVAWVGTPWARLVTTVRPRLRAGAPSLVVDRITDGIREIAAIRAAVELNASRIPESEQYQKDEFVALIQDHLAGQFGPHRSPTEWRAYLLVATRSPAALKSNENEVVGMLLAYADNKAGFTYVPYLTAQKPPTARSKKSKSANYWPEEKIGSTLLEHLFELRKAESTAVPLRVLCEVDHPLVTKRAKDRARIQLFQNAAVYCGVFLKYVDFEYLAPKLDLSPDKPEQRLALLYGTQQDRAALPRCELVDILCWLYGRLYSEDIFYKDPAQASIYGKYVAGLRERVLPNVPERIALVRARDIGHDYARVAAGVVAGIAP